MRLARRDDEIVGLVLLQHEPHRPDVVPGEAPVPLGVEIAEPHLAPEADRDRAPRRG